jgi:hypothetical protein
MSIRDIGVQLDRMANLKVGCKHSGPLAWFVRWLERRGLVTIHVSATWVEGDEKVGRARRADRLEEP